LILQEKTNLTRMKNQKIYLVGLLAIAFALESCNSSKDPVKVHSVSTADKVSVDRFSADAGHLMVRTSSNGLPAANAAVNFDSGEPFITLGKGPAGQDVQYYNFDVQPVAPAPIYVLFKQGESTPVDGQFNIIDVIPGEANYNDFWQVYKVTVPASYLANEVASYDEIVAKGYSVMATTSIVNCPVVPAGSTASKRLNGESAGLTTGWYDEKVVFYFNFSEKALVATGGSVPTSPIYVCFNINPADEGGGPASGFKEEVGSAQTHNVISTLPTDAGYSPLWVVDAYTNASFDDVSNFTTAMAATSVGNGLATVNCPVVSIQ
jgi:hypothetical protein